MHFHLTRGKVVAEIQERHGFSQQDSDKIAGGLEESGDVDFLGGMFTIRDPTSQDSLPIQGLALSALGRGSGGAIGHYKIKEYLQFRLREAAKRPRKRGNR